MKLFVIVLASILFLTGLYTLKVEVLTGKPLAERDSRRVTAGWILLFIGIVIALALYYHPAEQRTTVIPQSRTETTVVNDPVPQ